MLAVRLGGVLGVTSTGFEAAVKDAYDPPQAGPMIVFRWGQRFLAAGVSV